MSTKIKTATLNISIKFFENTTNPHVVAFHGGKGGSRPLPTVRYSFLKMFLVLIVKEYV